MTNSLIRTCVLLCACVCATNAGAQDAPSDGGAQDRGAGAQTVVALPNGFLERTLSWGASKADMFSDSRDGFYPAFGGLISGSGIPIGAGYRHHVFGGAVIDASATTSSRLYTMMQSRIEWPRLLGDQVSIGAQVQYEDFTQINYFGIGADSLKTDQTDYRLRHVDAGGFATLRLDPRVSITAQAGLMRRVSVGSGSSALYPGIADRFDESTAPGLTQQPTYLHAAVSVQSDTRDVPGYPTHGGRYRVSAASFHDRDFAQYSFRRVEADAAQYIPVFSTRSTLALRGRFALTGTDAGQAVPFYLLPTLGGSRSLRGYADYRFRDRDLLLMNAEYRWPMLRVLDGAAFYDAGTVAPDVKTLARHLNGDYGFGLRAHARNRLLIRADVARSSEGTRVLLTFSAPFGWSNQSAAPYVP